MRKKPLVLKHYACPYNQDGHCRHAPELMPYWYAHPGCEGCEEVEVDV